MNKFFESVFQHYWTPVFIILNVEALGTVLNVNRLQFFSFFVFFTVPKTFGVLKTAIELGFVQRCKLGLWFLGVSLDDHFKTVDP